VSYAVDSEDGDEEETEHRKVARLEPAGDNRGKVNMCGLKS